eukprot:8969229-Pyramimonas_sp.AAC.1
MGRAAKLRRISEIPRQLPHASTVALAAFTKLDNTSEIPDACSTADIRAAGDQHAFQNTPYGPVMCTVHIENTKGKRIAVDIADPVPYWYALGKRSRRRCALGRANQHAPCSVDNP